MKRRTLGVVVVTLLIVFAGCASSSPSSNQTQPSSAPDSAGSGDTPINATTPSTNSPANTSESRQSGPAANGTFEIHSINVGQSDSTLIIGPTNQTMLIDTGDYRDDGEFVLDYLKKHDIDRIDYLVTTHPDADHIGGNAAVIKYYETKANGIGAVYDPGISSSSQTYEDYLDAVEKYDITLYETHAGDSIPFDGVQTQVLSPPENYIEGEDPNQNSIVLRLGFGHTSFVLPGDAEKGAESHLTDEYGDRLNSTVLKAGHHGSDTSSTNPYLDAVDPQVTLISSAYKSQYGHPSPEALHRFGEHDIEVYWTATHGNIVVTSDGHTIDIATQEKAPTDPTSLRDGDPVEPGTDGPVSHRESITVGSGLSQNPPEGTSTPAANTPVRSSTSTPTSESSETPATTRIASDGGTESGVNESGPFEVTTIHADAEGDDRENLNDEYLVLENTGSTSLDVSGWTVKDGSSREYTISSGTVIEAGETLTLHTGEGTDAGNDLYWGSGSAIWNNGGDTITVTNAQDEQVLKEEY
ncbi:competence-like protein [Halococcus morrhuae DSM 1307]|uniref:Competence-like protein n=1 Tax=Halococcus morrhuae DSM 1307 TaxID=931277 RepID=M0MU67_HALMO|nr:lamin tail domain-containing protein [Halococcus morrhuae]EMA49282.1 competence-like protein [Halococcus morrhuae DSM 1307]